MIDDLRQKLGAALLEWTSSEAHSSEESQYRPCEASYGGSGPCCIDAGHEQYENMLTFLVARITAEELVDGMNKAALDAGCFASFGTVTAYGTGASVTKTATRLRAHCHRDPSVIGCCGGTDQTCSCECSTCQDPE